MLFGNNDILPCVQSSFRSLHGADTALGHIADNILRLMLVKALVWFY